MVEQLVARAGQILARGLLQTRDVDCMRNMHHACALVLRRAAIYCYSP